MLKFLAQPETLDQVQSTLEDKLGEALKSKKPSFTIDRPSKTSNRLCFISHSQGDFRCEVNRAMLLIAAKNWSLNMDLEGFDISTEFAKNQFCIWIAKSPESSNRYFTSILRDLADTKHPSFYSRILRAYRRLETDLPHNLLEDATAAPTDYLVALEALLSAEESSQLIAQDPFLAARFRGLKRKREMLELAGGAFSVEEVAEVLGISRQAVDKRRASHQLLGLTQARRGYSYPSFQFEDGKTVPGLSDVLLELRSLDPWMQMIFFTSPNERLDGKRPLEALRNGSIKEVKAVAENYGEQGAQ
jgi:hypothetical protein